MDMQQTTTSGNPAIGLHLREVDRHCGVPTIDEVAQLAGYEPADIGLRLLSRTADMRCQDHVRQALQAVAKEISGIVRLVSEDVQCRAGDVSAEQLLPQRLMINDETAAQVEEQAAT